MSILHRIRPAIAGLRAYSSAHMEAPASGAVTRAATRMNANELPFAPPVDCGRDLNRYPHPQPPDLRRRLAAIFACPVDHLLLTRGSDEAIDLLVRMFCEARQDAIAITPPVFGMYRVAAEIQGAQVLEFPLTEGREFQPDWSRMQKELPRQCKLVFLCSPNNPLGNGLVPDEVLDFCAAMADKALVVVDEAYVEFSSAPSLASAIPTTPNLAVLRTLSKAWGLAGARVGAVLAQPPLIDLLRRILPPYPLPEPVRYAVMQATDAPVREKARHAVNVVLQEKKRLQDFLASSPLVDRVFPSRTNFLLVRFHQSKRVFDACARAGVLVRDQGSQPGLAGCLRLTVGSAEENRRLQAVLQELAS